MSFSLPMLIPLIIGVVGGVTCGRLYAVVRQMVANRQAKARQQLRLERLEERRAALYDATGTGDRAHEGKPEEIIRA